ncbi:MAG: DUF2550 domain-containing protein [Gemmatimonadota bacterium]
MGERLAVDAVWLFAAFLVLVVLAAGVIAVRRILLDRGGGTVDCGLRRPGGSWRLGVAAYRLDELRWYQAFGVRLSPSEVLDRGTLSVVSRRQASPDETASLGEGTVVVECRGGNGDGSVELAMSDAALTGFLAWLEAAPPGFYQGLSGLWGSGEAPPPGS